MNRVLGPHPWIPSTVVTLPELHVPTNESDIEIQRGAIVSDIQIDFHHNSNLMDAIGKRATLESRGLQYMGLRKRLLCFELMNDQRLWVCWTTLGCDKEQHMTP